MKKSNRTERILLTIRPELKDGIKLLFENEKLPDVFERLIWDEINIKLENQKKFTSQINHELQQCGDKDKDELSLKHDEALLEVKRLMLIQKKAFPKGRPENSQISSGAFYPDTEVEPT